MKFNKMLRLILALVFSFKIGFGQINWVNRGQVSNTSAYFRDVMQELVYDLEDMEWCNMKMQDYNQTLDEMLYQWHVQGTVRYTNGFVVSIQEIDYTNVDQSVFSRTIDGESVPHAWVRGRLNLRHIKVGFDVLVDLENPEPPHEPHQRYTGHYTHTLIQVQLDVTRNLLTKEMTSTPSWLSISGGSGIRMIYMPANNMTEVLSRRYMPSLNAASVNQWCRDIFGPKLVDISTNRVEFPEICFHSCTT